MQLIVWLNDQEPIRYSGDFEGFLRFIAALIAYEKLNDPQAA
jgi:hypothetical protein